MEKEEIRITQFDYSDYIKLDEMPLEYKEHAEFACAVCLARIKSYTINYGGECGCKKILKTYCSDIGKVIKKKIKEKENGKF